MSVNRPYGCKILNHRTVLTVIALALALGSQQGLAMPEAKAKKAKSSSNRPRKGSVLARIQELKVKLAGVEYKYRKEEDASELADLVSQWLKNPKSAAPENWELLTELASEDHDYLEYRMLQALVRHRHWQNSEKLLKLIYPKGRRLHRPIESFIREAARHDHPLIRPMLMAAYGIRERKGMLQLPPDHDYFTNILSDPDVLELNRPWLQELLKQLFTPQKEFFDDVVSLSLKKLVCAAAKNDHPFTQEVLRAYSLRSEGGKLVGVDLEHLHEFAFGVLSDPKVLEEKQPWVEELKKQLFANEEWVRDFPRAIRERMRQGWGRGGFEQTEFENWVRMWLAQPQSAQPEHQKLVQELNEVFRPTSR